MKAPNKYLTVILLLFVGLAAHRIMSQGGSLDPPPGPPAPTMKTLSEIDPGTPISSVPHTISESGTYYLAKTAETTSTLFNGITIWADHVTLDLKGFSLVGDEAAGRHGISIEGAHKDIMICNGTITNWGGNGVEGPSAIKCRFEDLRVLDNGGSGIHLSGDNQRVTDCTVSDNGGSGIHLSGDNQRVTDCTVSDNGGSGIYLSDDNQRVTDCTVSRNGRSAPGDVYGISVGVGSAVSDCTVNDNGTSASGGVRGIDTGLGSTVTTCTVTDNGNSASGWVRAIWGETGSTISGNTVFRNGDSAADFVYGIAAFHGNTVIGNTVFRNGTGAGGNVHGISSNGTVTGNTVSQNGDDSTGDRVVGISGVGAIIGNSVISNGRRNPRSVDGISPNGNNLVDQNSAMDNGSGDGGGTATQIIYYREGCVFGINSPPEQQ